MDKKWSKKSQKFHFLYYKYQLLQKESKSGEREYSIQYHIQLQDRLHNLHYIHTTIFILQYTQEKTVIKSNSSAIFEKIELLFSLTKNEI